MSFFLTQNFRDLTHELLHLVVNPSTTTRTLGSSMSQNARGRRAGDHGDGEEQRPILVRNACVFVSP